MAVARFLEDETMSTISRQYRRKLTRALIEDPVLAAVWRGHKEINARGGNALVVWWRHYWVERKTGNTRRNAFYIATKWSEQKP